MSQVSTFSGFLPDSKVWVYQSNRELTQNECEEIAALGERFASGWSAHGSKLKAGFRIKHKRFLIFVADESLTMTSGCSIDASIGFVKNIENRFNIILLDRMNVAFKSNGTIKTVPMAEFEKLLKSKEISVDTIVFNNLVQTIAELESGWEVPVKESWHNRLL